MDAGSVSPDMRTRLNLLTVIILSVYVDGLSLILRLSRPSPSLAQNAGRVERVSVKNAGLEPLSLSLSLSMTTLTPPPPPPPLRAKLYIDHAPFFMVVAGRAGTGILLRGTLAIPHIGRA